MMKNKEKRVWYFDGVYFCTRKRTHVIQHTLTWVNYLAEVCCVCFPRER